MSLEPFARPKAAISSFQILANYAETKPYLDQVRAAADAHRNSLGFLAASVYTEFARNSCLYVLVDKSNSETTYSGHLLFTQRYPIARVVQMFTSSQYRRNGLAARILNHFKEELTIAGFTSIYASVAEDLVEANIFWEKQGFYIQTVKDGGKTRKRKIICRCHELQTPQLIPSSGISTHNPLGLKSPSTAIDSLFLLDLNVLFDLTGPRRERHKDAVSLFQAERLNICKLAVSNEIREELHRTAAPGKLDPMEGFIDILPSFPLKKFDGRDPRLLKLASIVFPEKNELSANDKSDLCHIATAAQHGLSGLITNDSTVLEAGPKIKVEFGIEILSPTAFLLTSLTSSETSFEGNGHPQLTLSEIEDPQFSEVHAFLNKLGISPSAIATKWLPTGANSRVSPGFAVWMGEGLIGYITWSVNAIESIIRARAAVDTSNPAANDAARILLTYLVEQIPQQGPQRIDLDFPSFQPIIREFAISLGFRGELNEGGLYKIVLGGVVTEASWSHYQAQLLTNSGIKLPDHMPKYQHAEQQIPVATPDGNRRYITLTELETLLSPALFCLPGRPAVITPIQRSYAEPLLGHSTQGSLLPSPRVSLFQDRHYISASKTLHHFQRGTLILFYESSKGHGRCAIVAIARVHQAYLRQCEELNSDDLEHSVLPTTTHVAAIGKNKTRTITVFDNIFILPRPVSLTLLRHLDCGSTTQLISTNPISDTQLKEILHEAFCHDR
jgi:predicted nucleic acid-binding protein/GNAT superfamily N-acetyltransferase